MAGSAAQPRPPRSSIRAVLGLPATGRRCSWPFPVFLPSDLHEPRLSGPHRERARRAGPTRRYTEPCSCVLRGSASTVKRCTTRGNARCALPRLLPISVAGFPRTSAADGHGSKRPKPRIRSPEPPSRAPGEIDAYRRLATGDVPPPRGRQLLKKGVMGLAAVGVVGLLWGRKDAGQPKTPKAES